MFQVSYKIIAAFETALFIMRKCESIDYYIDQKAFIAGVDH